MVQSWENFMDPSGGYRRNDYVEGTTSMVLPLITEGVLLPMVYPRAEMMELRTAKGRASKLTSDRQIRKLTATREARMTRKYGKFGIEFDFERRYAPEESARRRATATRRRSWQKKKAEITKKYAGLKSTARAVGWGYLALMGVEMGAALFTPTPGVTTSAMENDARAMGYNAPLDSSQAYTQRQRALMAIHDSQLGIRNVIGAEAPHLHR